MSATIRSFSSLYLATLLMVLGPERGLAFAEREGIKALFVTRGEQGFVTQRSSAFQRWLVKGEQQ